jgi:hypothetical protein
MKRQEPWHLAVARGFRQGERSPDEVKENRTEDGDGIHPGHFAGLELNSRGRMLTGVHIRMPIFFNRGSHHFRP